MKVVNNVTDIHFVVICCYLPPGGEVDYGALTIHKSIEGTPLKSITSSLP